MEFHAVQNCDSISAGSPKVEDTKLPGHMNQATTAQPNAVFSL